MSNAKRKKKGMCFYLDNDAIEALAAASLLTDIPKTKLIEAAILDKYSYYLEQVRNK